MIGDGHATDVERTRKARSGQPHLTGLAAKLHRGHPMPGNPRGANGMPARLEPARQVDRQATAPARRLAGGHGLHRYP